MSGVVKEEMLTRFGELGMRVTAGSVRFDTALLRAREFLADAGPFRFLDVDGRWQEIVVPAGGLAFTWCQVPFVYRLDKAGTPTVTVTVENGERSALSAMALPAETARHIFQRSGRIRRIDLVLVTQQLHAEQGC
jgi:hypothetical protein